MLSNPLLKNLNWELNKSNPKIIESKQYGIAL